MESLDLQAVQPADISVIIPVYNGGESFVRCLDGMLAARPAPGEIILVDDGSTDGSCEQAQERGVIVLHTERACSGPAVARNLGAARAQGTVLYFVDADVLIAPDVIARVAQAFQDDSVSAILGSYDDTPENRSFPSQYKNLFHHYTHQQARIDSTSFWAGCGAVRCTAFWQVGGFATSYARPSIEDIDLGYRLRAAGHRIQLLRDLQVKHLKRWTWGSFLKSDIFDRAIPWGILMLRRGEIPADLNLQFRHRVSAFICVLLPFLVALLVVSTLAGGIALLSAVLVLLGLNLDLYRFFMDKRGAMFAFGAVPVHWLYYLYSALSLAVALLVVAFTGLHLDVSFAHLWSASLRVIRSFRSPVSRRV